MPKRRQSPDASRRNFLKGAGLVGAARRRGHAAGCRQCDAGCARGEVEGRAARPAPGRGRDHAAGQRSGEPVDQRRRFHDRRAQFARHRIHGDQLRLELPRPARGDRQSRQQQARDHHLRARGHRRPHGAGLRQDRRQADGHGVPRRRRPAARHHGDVQRLVRPRARPRHGRQYHGGRQARARRRVAPCRRRYRTNRPRIHQVGRPAGLVAAFRRVGGARL